MNKRSDISIQETVENIKYADIYNPKFQEYLSNSKIKVNNKNPVTFGT